MAFKGDMNRKCPWLTVDFNYIPYIRSGRLTNLAKYILVPRGRAPFGQHQESRPLAESNTGSPRFTDFPSLCACSESSLTNLIGSGLNLLCLQSHSKPECRWTKPEVAILGADQKERGLWRREWAKYYIIAAHAFVKATLRLGLRAPLVARK